MLKFKIKHHDYDNKIELDKRFSKRIQIAEDLDGVIVNGNVAVQLCWNSNSES